MTTSFDETMQNGRLESGAIAIHDDMSDEELEKLLQMSFEDDAQGSQRQTSTKNKTAKTVTKQTKAVADADVTIAKKTEADTAKKRPFDTEFDTKSEPMPQSKDAPVTATTTTADASTGTTKIIINNETHEGTDLNNKHDAKLKAEPIEKPHKTIINTAIDHTKYQSTPTTHTVNEKQNTANASKPKNESAELTVNSAFSSERAYPTTEAILRQIERLPDVGSQEDVSVLDNDKLHLRRPPQVNPAAQISAQETIIKTSERQTTDTSALGTDSTDSQDVSSETATNQHTITNKKIPASASNRANPPANVPKFS